MFAFDEFNFSLLGTNFENVDFRRVPLSPSVSFKKSRLVGANFAGKELKGVDFSGADLKNAIVEGTFLLFFIIIVGLFS